MGRENDRDHKQEEKKLKLVRKPVTDDSEDENLPVAYEDKNQDVEPHRESAKEGKDIATMTQELITANMFGDGDTSIASITQEVLDDAKRLSDEVTDKRSKLELDTLQDRIINGQLYNDLANKSIDVIKLKIDAINAISKFVPKKNGTSVNIAQQLNTDVNNYDNVTNKLNPVQFNQIIEHAETKGLNPISAYREMESGFEQSDEDSHNYEEVDGDEESEDIQDADYEDVDVIYSPKPEDFDG